MKILWGLFVLGLGFGTSIIIGERMGETALLITLCMLAGMFFGVFLAMLGYRFGVRSAAMRMEIMNDPVPQQPAQPIYTIDPSMFQKPAPQPKGGLMSNGTVRTLPSDVYQ